MTAARPQVVVIGDVLLDETLEGPVLRISPEAPVPVVSTPGQHYTPGGAGLAALLAANHAGDDQAVTLITALNDDQAGTNLLSLLSSAGVEVINLGTDAPTAVKTRIRSSGQTLLMLDRATPATTPTALTSAARTALRNASAILVSDYGRGITAHPDTRNLLSELAAHIPVIWDPHPRGSTPVPGTTMVTPNSSEAHHFATPGVSGQPPITALAADTRAGEVLLKLWKAKHIAVTRGSHGIVLVCTSGAAPVVIPAPAVNAVDTCGAGDAFAADIATQLALGVLPTTATAHAVRAAAAFVAKQSIEQRECSSPDTTHDILQRVARRRAEGATIVATGGCFDLLHRGHITMLQQARALGDLLVVCLNSDESVTRLKGHPRPIVTAADRAAVLSALGCVDEVVVFDEDTPEQILDLLRPDVFVKGGDYAAGDLPERTTIESHGGQIVLVTYLDGRSSTHIINRATSTTPHATA
ncbi:D-glycero-beta-D-manno-heptose 1-phosphate adenylyltransferase [Kineosporia babensis]|uniref:D-glycero-beta-D-manno-heptose 1-phosphate adenylyltransferase n=2 Tax=Kineosporia babensis TaxID=499548 RepID=A0A9X1NN44_9ACTN|nr:D-glycero-beta-D-manno-heptose 1-phosphate adenylyltransferase [Kineosporia babensis]